MKIGIELAAASSAPPGLSILSERDSHGHVIIQGAKEMSGGQLEWSDGMFYPVLHWLEDQRFVRSRWVKSDFGRKRKYYSLHTEGRQLLRQQKARRTRVIPTLNKLWRPHHA